MTDTITPMTESSQKSSFISAQSLFSDYQTQQTNVYVTQEFQDYGYRLAAELDDLKHKSLYIKLAKEEERGLLEVARSFVLDADSARSKAKLFMWKLRLLREEKNKLKKEK